MANKIPLMVKECYDYGRMGFNVTVVIDRLSRTFHFSYHQYKKLDKFVFKDAREYNEYIHRNFYDVRY